jgi:hypothetical protein
MAETICLHGRLEKGSPCWLLHADSGDQYSLVGNLSGVSEGETVFVCGVEAQASFCGTARTLAVTWISTEIGGKSALPAAVVRDIKVTATLSTRDLSPTFKLEEHALGLTASSNRWVGRFSDVRVEGKLNVFFMSAGWKNQDFTVSVEATDPDDGSKSWKGEWQATVEKGHVVINKTLDVGAAA